MQESERLPSVGESGGVIPCPPGTDRGEKGDEMMPDFCRRCDERKCPMKKEAR